MASTLLRTPAYNPGLAVLHNSKALAAFSPLVFEWTRRDYEVVSVAENGGRSNQLDIVVAGDITSQVSDGGSVWLSSTGFYSGLLTTIGSSYSAPNTTITTTALKNASAVAEFEFINLISDRVNYRLLCDLQGVSGVGVNTGSIASAVITPGVGPLFRMQLDASPFLRSEFDLSALPDFDTADHYQQVAERGFLFLISYSELWDGNVPTADTTDTFLALPASKTARDLYGENAIDLEVWENSLPDNVKPCLSTALPNPVYFPGWPLFASLGVVQTDEPTWQAVQTNSRDTNVFPSTTYTNALQPPAGFHLISPIDTGLSDLTQIQLWLEAGIFWSLWTTFEFGVDVAFFPAVNATAGTFGNWLFEDGSQTTSAANPNIIHTTGLDGTLQEVKVTGITADQIQQFACIAADAKIYGVLSFAPCSLLSSIVLTGQSTITSIVGPTTTATNLTQFELTTLVGLTSIDLSGAAILSGSFQVSGCTALTNITLPTVAGYVFDDFVISGCTSFVQNIPLGIKLPNLMQANGCTVNLSGNGWIDTTVDYYLAQLDEACLSGYTGRTIDISGNTAPTAAAIGSLVSLAFKGVTVTTD